MNKEQKIEYIWAKCIEANPSIKDLKMGCKLDENGRILNILYSDISLVKVIDEEGKIEGFSRSDWAHTMQIIGREIRLADVLLALSKVGAVTNGGKYLINIVSDGNSHIDYRWNLLKDSLTEQSEETIEFIYSLLK